MNTSPAPANVGPITLFCAAQAGLAIVAFASNALLCRVALLSGSIDAATFSNVRLLAGGVTLLVVIMLKLQSPPLSRPDWVAGAALGVFVVLFSFAYVSLSVSTGALVFSGTVQLTLFVAALVAGERVHRVALSGYLLALVGILWLVVPGVAGAGFSGSLMMIGAGIAWACYTFRGMRVACPLSATTGNFILAAPVGLVLGLVLHTYSGVSVHASATGVAFAVVSGSLASAIGFVVWYSAVRRLTGICVAAIQLLVPPVAALGGVLFLHEHVNTRLVLSSATILFGIALTISVSSGGKRLRRAPHGWRADPESTQELGAHSLHNSVE